MHPEYKRIVRNLQGVFVLKELRRISPVNLNQKLWLLLIAGLVLPLVAAGAGEKVSIPGLDPAALAKSVMIHRDRYGMPHIDGPTDESVIFGFAYCQAEDYLWQIEESYVAGLGRASELHGEATYPADRLNRLFEIPTTSREDYEKLDPKSRAMCAAFTTGLNYFVEKNPRARLRLLKQFEPWHVLAFGRNITLGALYQAPRDSGSGLAQTRDEDDGVLIGSNAYAIAPAKTRNGTTMLFSNPHQPYYGFGQFYEAHLRSSEGLNFSGATFFGSPLPTIGHNEQLGWTFTVNKPDTCDSWLELFDDPTHPLQYKYGEGHRTAIEWQDTIKIKTGEKMAERAVTFRKTHHGPIADKLNDSKQISVNIAKFREAFLGRQSIRMLKARNLSEFKAALETMEQHFYNVVYADRDGNILYLYNGLVPKRDRAFDWMKPVDGSDPRTEWHGYHALSELPQVLNPISGFVQNCNQTPYTTTDDGSPTAADYPAYMIQEREKNDDKRRAKMARYLLRNLKDVTFEKWQEVCLDTTIYWAMTELPKFKAEFAKLQKTDPALAEQVQPYLNHLLNWDCRGGEASTQASLCIEWYEELAGAGRAMRESLKPEYINHPEAQFKALITAAEKLKKTYGDWKVAWGDVYRLQRHANVAELARVPFSDNLPSLPTAGLPGPVGVAFTQYYTPAVPGSASRKKHYAVVGNSFMGVFEFGKDFVRCKTLLQYGTSSDPASPHFFDQAALVSKSRFKESPFAWKDVLAQTERSYHPGEN